MVRARKLACKIGPDRFGPMVMLKPVGLTPHGRGMEKVRMVAVAGRHWRDHPMRHTQAP